VRKGSRAAIAVVVAILLLLPFAGIAGVTIWDRENSLQAPTLETVPVRSVSADSTDPVDIALTWDAIPPVFAPSWSGTVTALKAQTVWKSADLVVQVDRVWRIAFASDAPFTRLLSIGDTGQDVASLRVLLTALKLPSEPSGALGYSSMRGVQALATRLGVPGRVTSFDPSWVIFLPRPTIDASQSLLQLGGPAPSQGEPIVPTGKELSGGTLVAPGQFGSLADDTAPLPDAPAVNASSLAPAHAATGSRLMLGTARLALESDGIRLSAAGLSPIVGTLTPGAAYVDAELVVPVQQGDFLVPAASIVADPSGATCVITDKVTLKPIRVTVVNNTDDSVEVAGRLSTAYRLVVDIPAARRSCG
jgi:hypothetical protein